MGVVKTVEGSVYLAAKYQTRWLGNQTKVQREFLKIYMYVYLVSSLQFLQ